jgi:PHD/YefM family antitoxin component YafN of YafNO toxin-antitoxin module
MINPLPQIVPVSDLKHRHLDVFKRLEKSPIILANRSQAVAVLIAPPLWDALAERIDDLECMVAALQAELELAQGKAETVTLSESELEAWVAEHDVVPA